MALFHHTLRWDRAKDAWEWLLERGVKNGKWASFAHLHFTRLARP
jgi:hypothetical protein